MTKKLYTKTAQYRTPAWSLNATYMDGIYIDGGLFEENIQIVDSTVWIQVTPQNSHSVEHGVTFGFPSYQNGMVRRISVTFDWLPWQRQEQTKNLPYNGHPYGIGLNTIAAQLYVVLFPITRDIIYDVIYTMEVEI
jgi:hypothetical protein